MRTVYTDPADLPPTWDEFVRANPYLQRDFLITLQQTNPCQQRYVLFSTESSSIDSVLVSYQLNINILSFSKLRLPMALTIIGIPCSVAKPGYLLGEETKSEFEDYLQAIPGLVLIINADQVVELPQFTRGVTLPSCQLPISHSSFEAYINAMRSHYRYRYRAALQKGRAVTVEKLVDKSAFSPDLYALYEQVYQKSHYKLEKLSINYFTQAAADIYVFYAASTPIGFVQLKQHNQELYWLFGGINYAESIKFDTYINLLLFIVKQAIARGCVLVDFGQTAEDAKTKLGCQLQPKYMYVRHSNPVANLVIKLLLRYFDYEMPDHHFRVFKSPEEDIS